MASLPPSVTLNATLPKLEPDSRKTPNASPLFEKVISTSPQIVLHPISRKSSLLIHSFFYPRMAGYVMRSFSSLASSSEGFESNSIAPSIIFSISSSFSVLPPLQFSEVNPNASMVRCLHAPLVIRRLFRQSVGSFSSLAFF